MDTSSPRKNFSIKDSYVGGEIASLKNQISTSHKNDQIADLEKRTIILESLLLAERAEKLSESKKATASEQKPKPEAPVKPRTPPARVSMDDIKPTPPKKPSAPVVRRVVNEKVINKREIVLSR